MFGGDMSMAVDDALVELVRDQLVAFMRGAGTDSEDRTLDQILAFDDQLWNCCHNHMQWVFPTEEPSRFNEDAPLLDEQAQRVFQSDLAIQQNLRRCLRRFLTFLGLDVVDQADSGAAIGQQLLVVKAPNFDKRILSCWRGPSNHNWKRTSRVLRCLSLVGLAEEKRAFLDCLLRIVAEHQGMIDDDTVRFWHERAGIDPGPEEDMEEPLSEALDELFQQADSLLE